MNHYVTDEDRRRYPRIDTLCLLSFQPLVDGQSLAPHSMGRMLDISSGGARLELYQPANVGTHFRMDVIVNGTTYTVEGEVVHHNCASEKPFLVGVEFDCMYGDLVDAATFNSPLAV